MECIGGLVERVPAPGLGGKCYLMTSRTLSNRSCMYAMYKECGKGVFEFSLGFP